MSRTIWSSVLLAGIPLVMCCSAQSPSPTFRTESRLVEVYATVLDHKGHYIDGLRRESFAIADDGSAQSIVSFETNTTDLSCAILLDTTGSMGRTLPAVKNAIVHLIDQFREDDWIAVYGFSTATEVLQEFTRDRLAAKKAVLSTRAAGMTALFDAVSRVIGDISSRNGKRAVIVFTDGDDNASVLNARPVVERAKKAGIPVYTVAQGEALGSHALSDQLRDLAHLTGGQTFPVRRLSEIPPIFQSISEELQHSYLLTYKPPESHDGSWRQIQLSLNGIKNYKIRAKDGYFPY